MASIVMSLDEMEEIVGKLQQSSDEIEKIWNSIGSYELPRIKEAWAGKDRDAYINKVEELGKDVEKALKAQRLLAKTFEAARIEVINTQNAVASKVSGL